jgi:hypothetical protein
MGWTKSVSKGVKGATKSVSKGVTDTANTVSKGVTDTTNTVVKGTTDTVNTVVKGTEDAYNATKTFAESLVNDTGKAVQHATQVCAAQSTEYAKQGFDVASDTWKQHNGEVLNMVSKGVEYVEYAATEAYEWIDANACYIGLNMALTTGCVMYFTPKPQPAEPGTVTSTAISSTYLGWALAKGSNAAMATTIGGLITEGMWLIPGIKGNVDKQLLNRVMVNAVGTCNPTVMAVSLATPAGVGIFIGSIISPIVAQLVCEKIAPKGFTKEYTG